MHRVQSLTWIFALVGLVSLWPVSSPGATGRAASTVHIVSLTFQSATSGGTQTLFELGPEESGPTPLWTPHWAALPVRSIPVVLTRGDRVVVKATLACTDGPGGTFEVSASGEPMSLPAQRVELEPGRTTELELPAAGPLPGRVGECAVNLTWNVRAVGVLGQPVQSIGTTRHRMLLTLRRLIPHGCVYRTLVERSVQVAAGLEDEKEIADALLRDLRAQGFHYGRPGWDTYTVLRNQGGMCGGFSQLFRDLCAVHGIDCRPYFVTLTRDESAGESRWLAIDIQAPGLNNLEPTFRFDAAFADAVYPGPRFFDKESRDDDVDWAAAQPIYRFVTVDDGHCVNLLAYGGQQYMYDPSFGAGPYTGFFTDHVPQGPMVGASLEAFRRVYFDRSIDHLQGTVRTRKFDGTLSLADVDVKTSLVPSSELHVVWRDVGGEGISADVRERGQPCRFEDLHDRAPNLARAAGRERVDWRVLRQEMLDAKGAPRAEEVQRLVSWLSRRAPLGLAEGVPLPGVASPLELIQAAAIRRISGLDDARLRHAVDQAVQSAPTRYLESVRGR